MFGPTSQLTCLSVSHQADSEIITFYEITMKLFKVDYCTRNISKSARFGRISFIKCNYLYFNASMLYRDKVMVVRERARSHDWTV